MVACVGRGQALHNGRVVRLIGTCRVQFLLLMSMAVKVTVQEIATTISKLFRGKLEIPASEFLSALVAFQRPPVI